ncbi:MAG: DUF2249 domain-containing protein [Thiobacillaceae bacterium]
MDELLIDARGLEPPEPLERVLTALGLRRPGQRIRLLLHREPFPLYTLLQQRGLAYATALMPDGNFRILIGDPPLPAGI